MRNIFALVVMILVATSCTHVAVVQKPGPAAKTQKAPPGQVKKVTGSQSAAPYAPGQQKKRY